MRQTINTSTTCVTPSRPTGGAVVYAAEIAQRDPERIALIEAETGEQLTFRQFEEAANRVAHLFRDFGLRQRDRVAVFMENCFEMVEVQGGAERTGLYYTLVS